MRLNYRFSKEQRLDHSSHVNDDSRKPSRREWVSFWSLIGMQSTNAFNDSFTKFILIPLGMGLASMGLAPSRVEHLFALLAILPFILFAPMAGWLGDRFPKSLIIRLSSWFQLLVLILMGGGLWLGSRQEAASWPLYIVMLAFFLLAMQSALLSPSKMGVVKELVGSERLGFANGVMEGSVILMILLGQIIGGYWYDAWGLQNGRAPWAAAMIPVLWILIGAALSICFSHLIQKTRSQSDEAFSWAMTMRHFGDLRELRKNEALWRCALGIAFFWSFGGFLQMLLIQMAEDRWGSLEGLGVGAAILWIPVVVGIVIGSLLASWICNRRNELGLIVIGGALMCLATGFLAIFQVGAISFLLLVLAGFGGALYLVPLNVFLQDRAPENHRGMVLSASNLCINLGLVLAVGIQFFMSFLGVPFWLQFILISGVCGWATFHIMRLLPKDFIRLVFLGVFRSIYKIRALGVDQIPKEGGILMVPNHLSYIDAFVLSAACPRPIRFVLFADCFESKWVGGFARLFDAVAISPSKARDGIRITANALKEGTVVCVFAEGQLSRTGALCEIKRGYQMMAKKGNTEVLPAYMDGLWGSMWSFSEGNFLRKLPQTLRYGVTVAFGPPIPWNVDIGDALRSLSVKTTEDREGRLMGKANREPEISGDLPRGWTEMRDRCFEKSEAGRGMRMNAMQLSQVHMAHRRTRLLVEWLPEDDLSGILGVLWPLSVGATVSLADGLSDAAILAKVSREGIDSVALRGVAGREDLVRRLRRKKVIVWTFDEVGLSDGSFFGCLVENSRVASFARPNPDYETTTMLPQSGWREGRRGKLLPGWEAGKFGPLDEEGFIL